VSFCAVSLMIALLLLASACSVFMEDWSYVESLYAWFTTFTTIGFDDYIHLDSIARKAARGEILDYRVVLYGLISCFPYIMGLTLVSCMLCCLVDSVENVRNFRDRCAKFLQKSPSLDTCWDTSVESKQAMILKPVITELNLNWFSAIKPDKAKNNRAFCRRGLQACNLWQQIFAH